MYLCVHVFALCMYLFFIVSLVALEGTVQRLGRFANYLRAIIPHQDVSLTEMVAKAIGQLALCEGNYTAGMQVHITVNYSFTCISTVCLIILYIECNSKFLMIFG